MEKQSASAVLVLALLTKFPKANSAASTGAVFHEAITSVFEPLREVYSISLEFYYADKFVKFCFPWLAAWMADKFEQSLLTSIIGGFCLVCTMQKDCLGQQAKKWHSWVQRTKNKKKKSTTIRLKR